MPPPQLSQSNSVATQRFKVSHDTPATNHSVQSQGASRLAVFSRSNEPLSAIESEFISKRDVSFARKSLSAAVDVESDVAKSAINKQATIPANPAVEPLAFHFQSDNTGNADLETLTRWFAGLSASSETDGLMNPSFIGDPNGDWGYHLDNNDGYLLYLNTVTFSGPKFKSVYRDIAQTEYAPPHWKDLNHNDRDDRTENDPVGSNLPGKDMGEPVSFGRNSQMKAQINVTLDYLPPPELEIYDNNPIDKFVYLRGITYYDLTQPPLYTEVICLGDPKTDAPELIFELTFTPNLMDTVYHWSDMQIDWQYVYADVPPANSSNSWLTFNESHNANYVTLDASIADKLFLTLAYYGTLHAHGENSAPATAARMWEIGFKDAAGIERAEDYKNLHYYGGWLTQNDTLPVMLRDIDNFLSDGGDGQCNAWAEFWVESLKAHRITGAVIKTVKSSTANENMVVKNWTFGTPNVEPAFEGKYAYKNTFDYVANTTSLGYYDNTHYLFHSPAAVTDNPGIPGQNTGNPRSIFDIHKLVKYENVYYDPSYGKTYSSLRDFDDTALIGYARINIINNTTNGNAYFRPNDLNALELNEN